MCHWHKGHIPLTFGLYGAGRRGLALIITYILADGYYKWLQHMYSKGQLPKDALEAETKSKQK